MSLPVLDETEEEDVKPPQTRNALMAFPERILGLFASLIKKGEPFQEWRDIYVKFSIALRWTNDAEDVNKMRQGIQEQLERYRLRQGSQSAAEFAAKIPKFEEEHRQMLGMTDEQVIEKIWSFFTDREKIMMRLWFKDVYDSKQQEPDEPTIVEKKGDESGE